MPKTRSPAEVEKITITLSRQAADSLEILVKNGFYGSNRAQAASMIIFQHLQDLWKSGKLPG